MTRLGTLSRPGRLRRSSRPRRAGPVALALVGVAVLAAGCGGGPAKGVASIGKTSSSLAAAPAGTTPLSGASVHQHFDNALKFSQCMRAHGLTNFPDPTSRGGIEINSSSGLDPNSPQFQAAQEACHKYMPGPSPAQQAQQHQSALKFAACMRANGVPNFPDPQFGPNGGIMERLPSGVDPNSPGFQAAAKKCNS